MFLLSYTTVGIDYITKKRLVIIYVNSRQLKQTAHLRIYHGSECPRHWIILLENCASYSCYGWQMEIRYNIIVNLSKHTFALCTIILLYICINRPCTAPCQCSMNFLSFRRLVSRSASSNSVPRYYYCCHDGMDSDDAPILVLGSELLVCSQF